MFYIRDRRVWVWVRGGRRRGAGAGSHDFAEGTSISIGSSNDSGPRWRGNWDLEGGCGCPHLPYLLPAPASTPHVSETGESPRAARGRPTWTDALFFLVLAMGAGLALYRLPPCHGRLRKSHPDGHRALFGMAGLAVASLARGLMVACALSAGLAI